jgi:sigma-E processing peptidase SpoIIGA
MVVNGDLTMVVSVVMDAALLALTGRILSRPVPVARLIAGGLAGSVPTLLALLGLSVPAGTAALITPFIMVWMGFAPAPRAVYWKGAAWLLAGTMVTGGAGVALVSAGVSPALALAVMPLILTAAVFWWRRQVSPPFYAWRGRARVRCWLDSTRVIELVVFWDTGNQLQEPVGGRPVMVVARAAVAPGLPPELRSWVDAVLAGGLAAVPEDWSGEAGVMRVGTATGRRLLPVLAVRHAEVEVEGRWQPMKPLAIGVTAEQLSPEEAFDAILNPDSLVRAEPAGA